MSWATEELKTANLGDKRRNQRLIKIVEDLSAMPHASVTQAYSPVLFEGTSAGLLNWLERLRENFSQRSSPKRSPSRKTFFP
jgi:hypothetical protein